MKLGKNRMSKNNRNKIVQWSLTFPTVERSPEQQLVECDTNEFARYFPPYEYIIVSKEAHGDVVNDMGDPVSWHFHVGIKLKKGLTFIKMLNWVQERFEHDYKRIKIEPVKNMQNWIDYCKKEDPNPFEWAAEKPTQTPEARRAKLRENWPEWLGDFDEMMAKHDNAQALYDKRKEKAVEMMMRDFDKCSWAIGGTVEDYVKENFEEYLDYVKWNYEM